MGNCLRLVACGVSAAGHATWLRSLRPICDRECVSAKIEQRTGFALGPASCSDEVILPNGATMEDGLSEEEAIFIALWNNAAFLETLADLGIAHGDLIQAGLLPNPEVVYFFPVSEKPFKYLIDMPIEAIWLRPIRIAAAQREADRVCERLTQSALDLVRDVRQAHADVLLAQGRLAVAEEALRIRSRIAELAKARLEAGDISGQEAATARIDALQAQQEMTRFRYDVDIAEERLRNLLTLGMDRSPLTLEEIPPPLRTDLDAEQLTAEATETRPDARAAEQAAAAACERLRLSRLGWFRLLGILDATSGRDKGHEWGPAFRVTLPIFNWNQGGIARRSGTGQGQPATRDDSQSNCVRRTPSPLSLQPSSRGVGRPRQAGSPGGRNGDPTHGQGVSGGTRAVRSGPGDDASVRGQSRPPAAVARRSAADLGGVGTKRWSPFGRPYLGR